MVTCRSIVGLMLLLDLAMASRVEASPDIVPHGGSWALEFQVQPISGSSQYGIATKYHLTEHSAARLGFLVTVGSGDSETSFKADQTDIYGTTTTTYGSEFSSDQTSGSVFLHYVRYAPVADHFGLSLDAGPVYVWEWSQGIRTNTGSAPSDQGVETYIFDQKSYGFELQAGFEWHFVRRLSLAGRYGISALRDEARQTLSSGSIEQVRTSDGFTVQTSSSLFSLIAYW